MDPSQIKVGMKGIGKSVFKGTKIEEFQVEVLGVLPKAYLANDMILVRCSGANLERTGIIAGMSGSPVYIDGKLVGAVATTYGFQKEPLALVTPIRAMVDVMNRTDMLEDGAFESEIRDPEAGSQTNGPRPIPTPMTVSGLDPVTCAEFAPRFARYGVQLVPGSGELSTRAGEPSASDLQPGAAVGVCLIRGDLDASGIGTLTYRDGNRIAAFGHSVFLGGAVNMPMVGGVIHAVMPSQELSFKIFSPTAPIGAVTQDRAPGIGGTIGAKVRMIPVRVSIQSSRRVAPGRTSDYHYEVLNHRAITADLFQLTLVSSLLNREQATGDFTARADMAMKLRGYPMIHSRRWFSGSSIVMATARELAAPLDYLLTNEFERVEIESIAVDLDVNPGVRLLTITRVVADRERAKPGDDLRLTVTLEPWRGTPRNEVIDVAIPRETPEGVLQLLVTTPDSALSAALDIAPNPPTRKNVRQMVKLIEQVGHENQLIVQGYVKKKGVVIDGERFPNLPPSMLALLSSSPSSGTTEPTEVSLLFEKRKTLDQIVTGSRIVTLDIER
jgi:hypothetical protein